jgi:hypothetical protein
MQADLEGRVGALEQSVKRQQRYTAIIIILMLLSLIGTSLLAMKRPAASGDVALKAAK